MASLIVTGCSLTQSTGEKIHKQIENSASIEDEFEKVQKPIVKAEQHEKELYGKMIDLDLKKYKEITKLSDEATASANKRQDMIMKEKKSIDKAYDAFKEAEPEMKKLDKKQAKNDADLLVETMKKRHDTFGKLYKNYQDSLDADLKLYDLFKKKDLKIEELQGQLEKVNQFYQGVNTNKEAFNKATKKFNEVKESLYAHADIKE